MRVRTTLFLAPDTILECSYQRMSRTVTPLRRVYDVLIDDELATHHRWIYALPLEETRLLWKTGVFYYLPLFQLRGIVLIPPSPLCYPYEGNIKQNALSNLKG